jgi:peptide/nickel transport system substrate-binding protein
MTAAGKTAAGDWFGRKTGELMGNTRREFITGAAAGTGLLVLPKASPFIRRAAAQSRKKIRFASAEPLTGNWDPTSHTILAQINIEALIFGQLIRCPMRPDNREEIVYELATGQKLIDAHTLEYSLRPGVKFHDGSEFTADDVKATMEYASQADRPASWYPGPVEVEVVDKHTARIHTEKSNFPASLFTFLAAFLPMMSAADVKDAAKLRSRPNGTGPLKFVEQKGNDTFLTKHPDWSFGALSFDDFVFSHIPDGTTRVLAVLSGEVDIIERLEPEQYATLAADKKVKVTQTVSTENKYIHFRCNKPPLDNPLLRKAIAYGIDRDQVVQVLGAAGIASNCYIAPTKFGYVDIPGYPQFDAAKCQALLAQAGFPKGNGLPEIEYMVSQGFYPKTKEYGEVIVGMLQDQGFPMKLTVMEMGAFIERVFQKPGAVPYGNMVDVGWSTGSPEPDLVLKTLFKNGLFSGYKDPAIDAAMDKERDETDIAKRRQVLQQVTLPTIADKFPSFSLFTSVLLHATLADLEGVYFYPNGPMDLSKAHFT